MLNQNTIESKAESGLCNFTDDELDLIRRREIAAKNKAPYDLARYEKLRHRLADEMARGYSLRAIANITRKEGSRGNADSWMNTLDAWARGNKTMREWSRYSDEPSLAERVDAALEKWFHDLDAERAAKPLEPGFVETSVFIEMLGGFKMAEEECEMVEISTPPGSGKTTNAMHYMAQRRKVEGFGSPVWMITLSESNISQKLISLDILNAMRGAGRTAQDYEGKNQYAIDRAIEDACQNARAGLLIVDEAQHIGEFNGSPRINSLNIINALRWFCDRGLFGIALLSNGEVYQRTIKSKNSTQLSSRMESWRVDAGKPNENDVDLIMAAWGVSGKREREKSVEIGTGKGGLRALTNLYRRSRRMFGEISHASMTGALKGRG